MTGFSTPAVRRMVLGAAFLAATLVAALPSTPVIVPAAGAPLLLAQDTARDAAREAGEAAREARRAAKEAAHEVAESAREAAESARATRRGLTIKGDLADRQYDSFNDFLDREPALAAMVLGIVFIVFLTPILIIALIIWYKMRKSRMQSETMLKLAERGIAPPPGGLDAVGPLRADVALPAPAGASFAEQAQALTRRAAWSDLRKGVLMLAFGLAITFHGLLEEGTAGWFGLVLLFVGVGYVVLWFFEDRQATGVAAGRVLPGAGNSGDARR